MKRIRVPEGMLKAAGEASGWLPWQSVERIPRIVEAVLRYISEHPQIPKDEQLHSMSLNLPVDMCSIVWSERDRALLVEWQRRCFVQEEPEIPEEIEDLIWSEGLYANDPGFCHVVPQVNKNTVEAYRRGLSEGLGLEVDAQGRQKGEQK